MSRLRTPLLGAGIVALALGLWPVADADARCALRPLGWQLMTPTSEVVPRDGGVVIGLFPGSAAATDATPELRRGRRTFALEREELAPGLARLAPTGRVFGRYTLEGITGAPTVRFARRPLGGILPRPGLARVERFRTSGRRGESRVEVRATFETPTPPGVVAFVVHWGEDDRPAAFGRLAPSQAEAVLFRSAGRCEQHPEGTRAPPEEGRARVTFVDGWGRLSPQSEAVTIR